MKNIGFQKVKEFNTTYTVNTTINTNASVLTQWSTSHNTNTAVATSTTTSTNTSTTWITLRSTTTTWQTSHATSTSPTSSFNTSTNTTTTWQTSSTFTTNWTTYYNTSSTKNTTTTFSTSYTASTSRSTYKTTSRGTSRSTSFSTSYTTSWTTTYNTTGTSSYTTTWTTTRSTFWNTSRFTSGGGGGGGFFCIVEGASIHINGIDTKLIQDLQIGDEILSKNGAFNTDDPTAMHEYSATALTGNLTPTTVIHVQSHEVDTIININNGLLKATADHFSIMKIGGKWKVRPLYVAQLFLENGETVHFKDVNNYDIEITSAVTETGSFTVYDVDTEPNDTFYANGILTHNHLHKDLKNS